MLLFWQKTKERWGLFKEPMWPFPAPFFTFVRSKKIPFPFSREILSGEEVKWDKNAELGFKEAIVVGVFLAKCQKCRFDGGHNSD